MNDEEIFDETTLQESEISDTCFRGESTLTEGDGVPSTDPGRDHLVDNYEGVIREGAIYYPVAYRFCHELGRGRQGIVYLANRQGARGCLTRHAIKIFDPGIYSSAERYWTDMGRIAAQVSVLQTLSSPHLVSMDSYDEVNGVGFLRMDAVRGTDLRYLLSGRRQSEVRRTFTPAEWTGLFDTIFRFNKGKLRIQPGIAIYVLRMMLKGLETLHTAGFIHSDIKPSNVMIDHLGYVKLIDYGRAVKPNEKVTVLLGSPLYMAPESHRREPATEQSDIYSVGMVGLEMMRGEPLVYAQGMTEKDLLDFKMALPENLWDLLPPYVRENEELFAVLRRMVDPDPAVRFPDAISAETDTEGLRRVHKQLAQTGQDTDYARTTASYMSRLAGLRARSMGDLRP